MVIVKILRKRSANARVNMDTGISVKIPSELAVLGAEIPDMDIICKEIRGIKDYYYKTIVPVDKVIPDRVVHPISELEARKYMECIRNAVYKHIHIITPRYDEDFFDEVCSKAFLHLYERDYFATFNNTTPIQSYISVAVKRLFIDWNRSTSYKLNEKSYSLNNQIGEEGDTFQDFVPDDTIKVEETALMKVVLKELLDFADGYNDGYIIPDVTGKQLIEHLVRGYSIEDYPLPDAAYKNLFKRNAGMFIRDLYDFYQRISA